MIGKTLVFMTGLMAIAALTAFLFIEPVELAAWLANPDVLLGVVVFDLALALVRLYSTEHAWRAGGGQRWLAALFLAMVVAIPRVAIAWVGLGRRSSHACSPPGTRPPLLDHFHIGDDQHHRPYRAEPIIVDPGQYGDDDLDIVEPMATFGEDISTSPPGRGRSGRIGLRRHHDGPRSHPSQAAALVGIPRNFGGVTP
jgi:hypothetical protein